MQSSSAWDWSPGKRVVADTAKCDREIEWREESFASPDGEQVAAVVNCGDGEFGVCVNEEVWEKTFEKAWTMRYSPDGRLSVIAAENAEWNLAVDGDFISEDMAGFMWGTTCSTSGNVIAANVQIDGEYGMIVEGAVWETLYEAATYFTLHPAGQGSAAVVQTESIPQADIETFKKGCFSVAVNGEAWDTNFLNCWAPVFDGPGKRVAATVRSSLYDYSIAVDGQMWGKSFQTAWDPLFNPKTGAVVAPVRVGGKWGMAQNGEIMWDARYANLWKQQFSADGSKLWAVVSPTFGRWTVLVDDRPWSTTVGGSVTDLAVSPDGSRAAAIAKEGDRFAYLVDDAIWPGWYTMAFAPVFSPDGKNVAAKVDRATNRYTYVLNGRAYKQDFDMVWDPVFSPEGDKVLLRVIEDGKYCRIVVPVNEF